MQTVSVKVNNDYLERVAKAKKPLLAVAELVWNGLDADATEVRVKLTKNDLGGLTSIQVIDNGHGIVYGEATSAFENLGGSWKRTAPYSKCLHRFLHGKAGRGRFQAFSLGPNVEWDTVFSEQGRLLKYTVRGSLSRMKDFEIDEPILADRGQTGTVVTISDVADLPSLLSDTAVDAFAEQLALYLMKYTDVSVFYDDILVDPSRAIAHTHEVKLPPVRLDNGMMVDSELMIIEWRSSVSRSLVLCDESGFPLHEVAPGVQAPGFNFTAYLKSRHVRTLSDDNALLLESLDPDISRLLDTAKEELKQHFRVRAAEQATGLVQEWVSENIYPYTGQPQDVVEAAERQVFDVLALNVTTYLPEFAKIDQRSKRLSFRLLKQAVEQNASAVLPILREVLDLPKDKQNELVNLLQKTTLTAIINASREVTDRLDFLKALELLVFNAESKESLQERKQLHRILAKETWIFGEEFRLSVDDQSLNQVLAKYRELLGKTSDDDVPVLLTDGRRGIVDLMLSRRIPQSRPEQREHLVIELKRPSQKVDDDVANQIRKYAFAVAADERFIDTNTRWHFVAVSNEISDSVRRQSNQRGKPSGLLHDDSDVNSSIWVKTWGQILEDAHSRLLYFQKQLNYQATEENAVGYLRRTHDKYLPECLKQSE